MTTTGLPAFVRKFRKENLDFLFFTKNKEWESEQELRLVYFSDLATLEFCKIEESLEAIYLGVDFNERYLPLVRKYSISIPIYKLIYKEVRLTDQLI